MKRLAFLFTLVAAVFLMASTAAAAFKDVPANHWAYDELDQLQELGIVEGYPGGYFRGENTLTRYEMAVLVYRLHNQLEDTLSNGNGGGGQNVAQVRRAVERLSNEFRDELDDLGARIDSVEATADDNADQIENLKQMVQSKGDTEYSVTSRTGYFFQTPQDDQEQETAIDWAATINKSYDVDKWVDFNLSLTYAEDQGFGNPLTGGNSMPGGNNESGVADPVFNNTGGWQPGGASFIVDNFNAEVDLHKWFPNFGDKFKATLGRQYFSLGQFGLAGENGFRSEYGTRLDAKFNNWHLYAAGFRLETMTSPVPGGSLNHPTAPAGNNAVYGNTTRFGVGSLAVDADDFDFIGAKWSHGEGDHHTNKDELGFELTLVPEGVGHEFYVAGSGHAEVLDNNWLNSVRGEGVYVIDNANNQDPSDLGDSNDDGVSQFSGILEADIYDDGNSKVSLAGAAISQLEGLPSFANVDNNPFAEFEITRSSSTGGIVPVVNVSRYGKNYFPSDFVGAGLSAETTFRNDLYARLTGYLGSRIDAIADDRPGAVRLDFRYPWSKSTTLGLDVITAGTTNNFEDSATQVRGSVNIEF